MLFRSRDRQRRAHRPDRRRPVDPRRLHRFEHHPSLARAGHARGADRDHGHHAACPVPQPLEAMGIEVGLVSLGFAAINTYNNSNALRSAAWRLPAAASRRTGIGYAIAGCGLIGAVSLAAWSGRWRWALLGRARVGRRPGLGDRRRLALPDRCRRRQALLTCRVPRLRRREPACCSRQIRTPMVLFARWAADVDSVVH